MSLQVGDFVYRYVDELRSHLEDEYGRAPPSTLHIYLLKFPVLKVTPCGVWIDEYGRRKFILLTATKRFALPTIAQAKASFIARKHKQIAIHEAAALRGKRALKEIERRKDESDSSSCEASFTF